MAQYTRVITATGGGIVEKSENWGQLRHGLVVFLNISVSLGIYIYFIQLYLSRTHPQPNDIYARLSLDPKQVIYCLQIGTINR